MLGCGGSGSYDNFRGVNSNDQWCKSLSVTFITLVLKKKGAYKIKGSRPFNLVGCLYKLLAKILALRLKSVLQKIILSLQNAFIYGRQIIDCSLLANECIDAMIKVCQSGIVCKIDMEKAYGHINWNYLE